MNFTSSTGTVEKCAASESQMGRSVISKSRRTVRHSLIFGVSDGGPSPHDVYLQSIAGGTPRNLTSPIIDRRISRFAWLKPDSIVILADEGFGSTLYWMNRAGKVTKRQNFSDQLLWDMAVKGSLLASIRSTAISPPELWITDGIKERQASDLHPGSPKLISQEIFRYASDDGMEIEAALFQLPSMNSPL